MKSLFVFVAAGLALGLAQDTSQAPAGEAEGGDSRPIWERIDVPSIAACGGCHEAVTREWSRSLHARAWTNANVRAATNDFSKKSCRPCHSPEPVLPKGLDVPPDFRDANHEDGVHCLSCHGLADGVAAARTIEDAPCRPRYEARFLTADLCFPCHQPTHQAFDEFRVSDAFALGLRCVDCHMQPRTDRRGRDHGPNGGFEPAFVRRAIAWKGRVAEGALLLEVTNRTGHKFPGEIPSRSFHVSATFDDGTREAVVLRRPFKGEEREDDRLTPDEVRTLRFVVPPGASAARVRLTFLPLPLVGEDEGIPLGTWTPSW